MTVPINTFKPSANRTALYENLNSTKGARRGATVKLLTGWFMTTDESHYYFL